MTAFFNRYRTLLLALTLALTLLAAAISPLEATLGWRARVVYFHGAWVWTGKIAFGLAALAGLAGLAALLQPERRLPGIRAWAAKASLALGRTGLVFWLTYLPMSLWVQQINWGGIFWDEPRWRVPLAYGVAAVLLQLGLLLFENPTLTCATNLVFGVALWISLGSVQNVLHPDSPIFGSGSLRIEVFFILLMVLSLACMAQIALAWWDGGKRKA
jgi:hypothetical protein